MPTRRAEELYRTASSRCSTTCRRRSCRCRRASPPSCSATSRGCTTCCCATAIEPEQVLRSIGGRPYLCACSATPSPALGRRRSSGPVYDALLPYAGLLNVGGGRVAGLPVDDVLGRLAALAGDVPAAVRHARDAVALARSMPSPPMLVHCLDHLADALARAGDDEAGRRCRAEAFALAATVGRRARPAVRRRPAAAGTTRRGRRPCAGRRRGWVLTSPLGDARLPDSTGLGQLARLLDDAGRRGGRRRACRTRPTRRSPPTSAPLSTRRPSAAYRRRLARAAGRGRRRRGLQRPRPRANGPTSRSTRSCASSRRAVGLGGRDRPTGVGRRAGPHQRGAQPPASDHRHRAAGPRARRPPRGVDAHRPVLQLPARAGRGVAVGDGDLSTEPWNIVPRWVNALRA